MKRLAKKITVPIYDAELWLVVSDRIDLERKRMEPVFGPAPEGGYSALCSYNGTGRFALFFKKSDVTLKTVSHEVFHLTHRILDWVGSNFDSDHHEQGALLNSYLMDQVFHSISRGFKIPGFH